MKCEKTTYQQSRSTRIEYPVLRLANKIAYLPDPRDGRGAKASATGDAVASISIVARNIMLASYTIAVRKIVFGLMLSVTLKRSALTVRVEAGSEITARRN